MKWKPLQPAAHIGPHPEPILLATMQEYNVSREEASKRLDDYDAECEIWINDLYQVQVRPYDNMGLLHINIRRRDGAHDIRDWRHFQRIKNEILGPESEAVELYPAESRLHDTSNKFHLWGYRNDSFRFPIGFDKRDVRDGGKGELPGMRQRPLDADAPEKGNSKVRA
jgi:hypothetical protein